MKKSNYNILVVDDDPSMKELLQRAIESMGYKVTAVSNPDEAIKAVRLKTIHFAIVDVMLSKINGVELTTMMRKSGLEQAPVILISGIFTDGSFAKDAIKKTGALDFFPKPFNLDEITSLIGETLKTNDVNEEVTIQSMLSQRDLSSRDRIRVVDQMDEVSGLDLIFVLNIFLESELSGHLNILDEFENVYGVSFCEGYLCQVDTKNSLEHSWDYLKSSKYFFDELDNYNDKFISSDLLGELVEKSLISPHVMQLSRKYQILKDLETIYSLKKVRINFSPLDLKKSNHGYSIKEVEDHWLKVLNQDHASYYMNFYTPLNTSCIVEGPNFSDLNKKGITQDLSFVTALIAESKNFQEILTTKMRKMGLVHYLLVKGIISFENFDSQNKLADFAIKKLSNTYNNLKDLDPFEIFKYFGASEKLSEKEVSILYKEFAKLNHPDKYSGLNDEGQKVVHDLFSLVTNAHNQLINKEKRKTLEDGLAQKSVQNQVEAEILAEEGLAKIQTGKYRSGIKLTEQSLKLYSSNRTKLYWCWGVLKRSFHEELPEKTLKRVDKIMYEYPAAERKIAAYQFVLGLQSLRESDKQQAFNCFKKALQIDSRFMNARREIAKLSKKKDDSNLFTGDITTVFTKIFKK